MYHLTQLIQRPNLVHEMVAVVASIVAFAFLFSCFVAALTYWLNME